MCQNVQARGVDRADGEGVEKRGGGCGGVCFTFNDSIAGMNHHQRSSALAAFASVICQSFVPALSLIES